MGALNEVNGKELRMKKEYFKNIDLLKAIACIFVIMNHTSSYLLINENYLPFYKIEFVLCRIAVPIFIMCTGYLMCTKELKGKDVLKKILKVLIPLFLLSGLIYFLQHKTIDFLFLQNFLATPIIEPYWYIYMLVGLYMIMPFLNYISKNASSKEHIFLISVILIIPAFLKIFSLDVSTYWGLAIPTYSIGYYFMGSLFYKIHDQIKFAKLSGILFVIFYIIGILFYTNHSLELYHIDSLLLIGMSILFMNFILGFKIKKEYKFFTFLSANSLYIYLFHPILQNKIYELSFFQNLISFNSIIGILFYQFVLLFICLALAWLCNYTIKKILIFTSKYISETS